MYTHSVGARSSRWYVIYYEDIHKHSEIFDFVDGRSDREKAKVLALLAVLEEQGPQLPRPYADYFVDGIHELRVKLSGEQVRILYFFCYRDIIVLTNVFAKTTDRVPTREIEKARKCRKDFLQRHDEPSLRRTMHEDT
ncbi:MAG: type II toxin-antitoxin system RelE/ParE family toxin [Candidatus Eisenbacteria bacterium]|nr:type II toxin-antitoxin system RelE/ParE family toxin [Candidatus Eisenbacteria bacterium]